MHPQDTPRLEDDHHLLLPSLHPLSPAETYMRWGQGLLRTCWDHPFTLRPGWSPRKANKALCDTVHPSVAPTRAPLPSCTPWPCPYLCEGCLPKSLHLSSLHPSSLSDVTPLP